MLEVHWEREERSKPEQKKKKMQEIILWFQTSILGDVSLGGGTKALWKACGMFEDVQWRK